MHPARYAAVLFALFLVIATAESDVIYNIQFSPKPTAALQFNQNVNITFDYRTSHSGGVRIFPRPVTAGALSPNYAASPSPLYPPGSGSGSGFFTITSGAVTVDSVRFQVLDSAQTTLLLEFFVPVKYVYSAQAIYDVVLTPATPSSVAFNQDVSVSFNYRTTEAGGARIFPRPMSGPSTTPNYAASPSPLYPTGSGSGSGSFTITSGNAKVDGVRFQMYNDSQSSLLLEFVVPVDYDFAAHSISNIQFTPSSPEGLLFNSNVSISFDYRTSQPGGVLIFPRPFTAGALTPNYAASPSPVYATGSGSGTGFFTITTGETTVDSVRFHVTSADQSQVLLDYFVPVNFHFAAHKFSGVTFSPTSPAYFTTNEPDTTQFNYTTTESGGALIFPRPFTEGALTPNYAASPSPNYPTGSGSGFGWFYIVAGNTLVDHVRLTMTNSNQSQTLVQWLYPVHFQFGTMTPTGVRGPGESTPASFSLAQNYPNPFNPKTGVRFQVPGVSDVKIAVYDLLGREVAVLVNERKSAGSYEVSFDGSGLSSGIYIYRLTAGSFVQSRKMVLIK